MIKSNAFCSPNAKRKIFPDKWIDWVMSTITGGKDCIKVNENYGPYFPTYKGLRHGDSLSPLMFNLAADALAVLMDNARKAGIIKGLLADTLEGGLNMLQCADATIFLLQDDYESACNLKYILCLFEQMSGLKINFHKSEIFLFGVAADKKREYSQIFTCPVGELPMKYFVFLLIKKQKQKLEAI